MSKFIKTLIVAEIIFFIGFMTGCINTTNLNDEQVFLNVSYDPTRELYEDYDKKFKVHWE